MLSYVKPALTQPNASSIVGVKRKVLKHFGIYWWLSLSTSPFPSFCFWLFMLLLNIWNLGNSNTHRWSYLLCKYLTAWRWSYHNVKNSLHVTYSYLDVYGVGYHLKRDIPLTVSRPDCMSRATVTTRGAFYFKVRPKHYITKLTGKTLEGGGTIKE